MSGKVKTRQKCRKCKINFKEMIVQQGNRSIIDMLCPKCGNSPKSCYIFLYLPKEKAPDEKHRKFRITRNENGDTFSSYAEANRFLENIRTAMDNHDFNISHYIHKEIGLYQGRMLLPKWLETKKDKAPSYRDKLQQYIDNDFTPFFGEKDMRRTIKTAVIEDFFMQLPSHDDPPDFCADEFKDAFTIDRVCEVLKNVGVLVKNKTIETINKFLKQPNLYKQVTASKQNKKLPRKLKKLIDDYEREKSEVNLKRVNRAALEAYYPQETPKSRHLSDKTKQNIMSALHNFVTWFLTREELVKAIKWPSISPAQPPIIWFSKEDQLKVYEHIHDRHKPIFWFIIWHPVRSMEAAALLVEDFYFQIGMVGITKSFSKNESRSRKNKKPYTLPIYKGFQQSMLQGKFPKDYAFKNKYGNHYTNKSLEQILSAACKKAGLPHIQVKNFTRHSIASQAINSGKHLATISKALGHSNLSVTRDRYACLEAESLREFIDGTDNVIDIHREPGTNT